MILEITPAIDYNVRTLCFAPYPGHKRGCPNYNKKEGCPPKAPKFEEVFNMAGPFYAIINQYNLKKHVQEMQLRHPGPEYWKEESLERNFTCHDCGTPPCRCSAVIFENKLRGLQ